MPSPQPDLLASNPGLDAYPNTISVAARFGDLGLSGGIEHIGMARCYEDVRSFFMQQLSEHHGVDRDVWRSFLVRAVNEQPAPVPYPDPIAFGAGVIAVGSRSYTLEMAAFQHGVCVGRSRNIAATVGADHAPAPVPDALRRILSASLLARPGWQAPGRPVLARRHPSHYSHRVTLPTRFSDTDAIGHLNNVSLLRYCDEGRAALLLAAVGGKPTPGWAGSVVHTDISYLQEATLPHPLTVASRVCGIDGPLMHLEQALFQRDVCIVVCDCIVRVASETAHRLAMPA